MLAGCAIDAGFVGQRPELADVPHGLESPPCAPRDFSDLDPSKIVVVNVALGKHSIVERAHDYHGVCVAPVEDDVPALCDLPIAGSNVIAPAAELRLFRDLKEARF